MSRDDNIFTVPTFRSLLSQLQNSACPESTDAWPSDCLEAMTAAGVMTWDMPVEFGGLDLSPPVMLEGLRQLSSADLVSTFIYTQRSAAVRRIATSDNQQAKSSLLPALRDGRLFATVGISHLTTSGQHLKTPLVSAARAGDTFILNGRVPWATGAAQADYLITGGSLEDGRQILAAVPTARDGMHVGKPVNLMALNASQTGAVTLDNVTVEPSEVLHGPVERVMQQGTGGGAGSLGTSALATGAACGTLQSMERELEKRPELAEFIQPMREEASQLTVALRQAASGTHPLGESAAEDIRRRANSLALRSSQAWLAATKGAGYVSGHPAERAVRESMFFLVWSCPQPVLAANLRELACAAR